jgi:hypothetical protein
MFLCSFLSLRNQSCIVASHVYVCFIRHALNYREMRLILDFRCENNGKNGK